MTAQTIETPTRVTSWTMPEGLTDSERLAYRKGYDKAARAYVRKHGAPTVVNVKPWADMTRAEHTMTARALSGSMVAHHEERHPAAHKAGMSALRSWVRKYDADPAARLALITDPMGAPAKPRTRKAPAVAADTPVARARVIGGEVAAYLSTLAAPVSYPAERAARKSARRELANRLRAAGIDPRGDEWTAATTAAGLATVQAVSA